MHQDIVLFFWVLDVTIMLHNTCNASYSLKKGKDDVSIRSLRVKRLSCPWLELGCHGRALDCSEHERLKTCRDFVATIAFANYKLVILSLSTWCLGVDGLTQRNPVRCFLNSQALHSWRQQWLTSDWLITAPVQSAGHNNSRRAQGVDKRCSNKTCRVRGWATSSQKAQRIAMIWQPRHCINLTFTWWVQQHFD